MTNETKEALELYHRVANNESIIIDDSKAYKTIKQALERLEELEEKLNLGNAVCSGFSHNGKALVLSTLEDYDRIMTRSDKLEKAIELLKEIGGLHLIKQVNGNDVYYALVFYGINIELEENEYNNFKEVLGNE